jgi:hypothetical protein
MKTVTFLSHPSPIFYKNIQKFIKAKNLSINEININIFWNTLGIGASLTNKSILDFPKSYIIDMLNFRRYRKLFKKDLGVEIKKIDNTPLYIKPILIINSIKILFSAYNNVDKLRSLHHNNTQYGDLVYYSYIKFAVREKVYFTSPFLFFLIYKSQCTFYNLDKYFKKYSPIDAFICNYTSYLQHGLPSRFHIDKKIPTYSIAKNEQCKVVLHKEAKYSHNKDWKAYNGLLNKLTTDELQLFRSKAKVDLNNRFKGQIDEGIYYMKVSPYSSAKNIDIGNITGVVFLHDFFDSCDDHDGNIFYDIYDWAEQTLKFIEDNNLNIAVKPHPNSVKQSIFFENLLKNKYKSIQWLDRDISNADIFKNIKAGISMFGSVFSEIAYHGLVPIAAGSHPAEQFNFTYQPSNKSEYFNLLMDINNLKPFPEAKTRVLDFYIAHNYLASPDQFSI